MLQKIVNGIAIASGVVSITVVGLAGYVYIRKDAIIENVKSKVMESVLPGGIGDIGDAGVSGAAVDGDGKPRPPPVRPSSAPVPAPSPSIPLIPPGITASIILPLTFSIIASLRMNT